MDCLVLSCCCCFGISCDSVINIDIMLMRTRPTRAFPNELNIGNGCVAADDGFASGTTTISSRIFYLLCFLHPFLNINTLLYSKQN